MERRSRERLQTSSDDADIAVDDKGRRPHADMQDDLSLFRQPGMWESVSGTVDRFIFKSAVNNYRIAVLKEEGSPKETITFLGNDLGLLYEGMEVTLHGQWTRHPQYGMQMRVDAYETRQKDSKGALIDFFSSSRFPGVGQATAKHIVETLGENAVDLIREDPEVLLSKCRIRPMLAQTISNTIAAIGEKASLVLSLMEWKVPQKEIGALMKNETFDLYALEKDCFLPYYQYSDFSYEACVRIANGLHIPQDDPKRIEAQIFRQIKETLFKKGSTFLYKEELQGQTSLEMLDEALRSLSDRGKIVIEERRIYLMEHWLNEICIASSLYTRHQTFESKAESKTEPVSREDVDRIITAFEQKEHITYDKTQREAIHTFFEDPMMILTGGPGTGKTTVVKGILYAISKLYPYTRVDLAAPTGRAAKRLGELSGRKAFTLHAMLGWDGGSEFKFNEANQFHPQWLIVDEFSMVDTQLFAALMKALDCSCRILLIGDEEQLESVGEGSVLADLIASHCLPVATLSQLYRQKDGSAIAQLADDIRHEHPLHIDPPVEMITQKDSLTAQIRDLLSAQASPSNIQLLAPKYEGDGGIVELNAMMQEMLNPFSPQKAQIAATMTLNSGRSQPVVFRVGDKVMLKVNLAELDVYNGDIGEIVEIDPAKKTVLASFDGTEIEISDDLSFQLVHGWAVTIHKAQGSEYRQLILSLPASAQHMFSRRLIYTAVSRAKQKLWIFTQPALFANASRRRDFQKRQTSLRLRMEQAWSESISPLYESIAQKQRELAEERRREEDKHLFGSSEDDESDLLVDESTEDGEDDCLYL